MWESIFCEVVAIFNVQQIQVVWVYDMSICQLEWVFHLFVFHCGQFSHLFACDLTSLLGAPLLSIPLLMTLIYEEKPVLHLVDRCAAINWNSNLSLMATSRSMKRRQSHVFYVNDVSQWFCSQIGDCTAIVLQFTIWWSSSWEEHIVFVLCGGFSWRCK